MPPFVSVLMTAYNRQKYIEDAIKSVIESSYTDFELIIVDDGSVDNTVAIAQAYEKTDKRIKLFVNRHNIGQFQNRNLAVSYASGKYIKFVDSDDLIYPNTLQIMVDDMEKYPEAAMGICQISDRDESFFPELISPETIYKQHFYGEGVLRYGPTGSIIKRGIFNKLEGFNHSKYISDTEFWLKLSALYPIIKLQPHLVFWRVHKEQEFYYGNISHSYIADAYRVYMNSLKSINCPLGQQDIKRIKKRLQWKQARDILSIGLKKRNFFEAFRIYKNSDISFFKLLSGILPYKIMKYRFDL
jgi:glycosyltransferase involved in cell wall biosynthesis